MPAENTLSDEQITRLYGATRSKLNNLSVQNIRNAVAASGIDVTRIPAESEARSGLGSRAEVMPAVDRLFAQLSREAKVTALQILAGELLRGGPDQPEELQALFGQHGFQFIDGQFVPVGVLDAREAAFLPPTSAAELARAAARLAASDWSGAITSACGAVDLATQAIYKRQGLGDPGQASFQTKVNTALQRLGVFEEMESQFVEQGMRPEDARDIVSHLRQSTNHAAQALQILRRAMGDTHGSRPALKSMAYDAVKWAQAICALFEGR
jgi:hypothetical protein